MALMERILEPYVVTPPAVEPLSLSEVTTHLRVDSTDEDTYLMLMMKAVRERTEAYINRALITQTLEVSLDEWWTEKWIPWVIPALPLPRSPLQSVSSVKYTDDAGVEATWASTNYFADTRSTPGMVVMKRTAELPSVNLKESGGIVVRYVAGFGATPLAVPADIKWAMLLWIGELYQNRENVAPPGGLATIPSAAYRLLDKHRVT